ncbi:MAG: MBL fold metallo-hydrolase [Deltaproteobacteria bacterium]|nr:MBL fold metallo-hydrolase [Deltaproteobacteria bacterium]
MKFRISPLWWPVIGIFSPVIAPFLVLRYIRYKKNFQLADELNQERLHSAETFEIPELEFLEMTVIVDEKAEDGFLGDAGVSYFFRSNQGSLLLDVGFGPDRPTFAHNTAKLKLKMDQIDALCISHLHIDHMGGLKAVRSNNVTVPEEFGLPKGQPCFVPGKAKAIGFNGVIVKGPLLLTGGIATTGPLSRSMFFLGMCDEQALFARLKGKGFLILFIHSSIIIIIFPIFCCIKFLITNPSKNMNTNKRTNHRRKLSSYPCSNSGIITSLIKNFKTDH